MNNWRIEIYWDKDFGIFMDQFEDFLLGFPVEQLGHNFESKQVFILMQESATEEQVVKMMFAFNYKLDRAPTWWGVSTSDSVCWNAIASGGIEEKTLSLNVREV